MTSINKGDFDRYQQVGAEIADHVLTQHKDLELYFVALATARALAILIADTAKPGEEVSAAKSMAKALPLFVKEVLEDRARDLAIN
jgi:hypothetical protein